MEPLEYKRFYEQVGRRNGWNFSRLQVATEGKEWELYEEVAKRCKPSDVLLDIGTGGGERLLGMAESALLVVGIDQAPGMIETALFNAGAAGAKNVRFLQMDAEALQFPTAFFDLVSCRQAPFCSAEVHRVLAEGGLFLTQQIGRRDKLNLKHAFGRGQGFGSEGNDLAGAYAAELHAAGFADVQLYEYDAAEYYSSYEDLLFLLKHTPIIPGFGEEERDFERLHQFIQEHRTEKGIATNSHRFMLTARK